MNDTMNRCLGGPPLAVAGKLVLLSVLVGVVLAALGLDPRNIFESLHNIVRWFWDLGFDAVVRLWRYFLLGAAIVIPVWLVMRLAKAPRDRSPAPINDRKVP